MAARGGRNNIVARRVIDDLIDISGERSPPKYLKIFIEQQITDHHRFIARMRDEIRTSTNLISQLNALIAELEASGDYEEVFDLVMELWDDRRDEQDKVVDFNRLIAVAEEKIHGKEIDLEMLEAEGNDVAVGCAIGIMETQAIDDQDPLVNYDNDNENDDLGYQSEEYFDEVQEDDENNHSNGNVVKRGITRLYKFRREYGKPDGIKLSVTFDALNRISGKHRALFSSFLGDMVREHIGLKILSWKKVDSEARDKLWDEITRYFDVDLTVRKLVMNRLGQLLRNFRRKLRQTYILPNQNTLSKLNEVPVKYSAILQAEEWVNFVKYTATEEYKVKSAAAKMARSKSVYQHTMGRDQKKEIEPDEEPARGTLWLKGRVNKDGEYPDDEIRSVGDKLKETEDKIKEGTLKVDLGTDAMTFVLGKKKGGYTRGVGSRVTYKRYFDLPRSRQASDERILLLQSQLDNERRERQEKELLIQNLSNKMSQTEGMVTTLKNQLAAQGGQFQSMSTQLIPQNETVNSVDLRKGLITTKGRSSRQHFPNHKEHFKDAVGGFFHGKRNEVGLDLKATPYNNHNKWIETEDKIKEGTLKVDHGTDAITVVLGKEKGGYARGVGSRVTYKRYFDLPRSRQASDERILLLQSQLDNERHELGYTTGQFQSMSTQLTPPNVSSVDINPINSSTDEEGETTVFRCENDAIIQKSNGLATLEKEMETRVSSKTSPCKTVKSIRSKKRTRSLRKDSSRQASQLQENVSPLLAIKCKLWHLKKSTIIALVDAACIPDVGNNGFKTVKDAVGGFFAWPKDLVVFDPKETPPSTIQMNAENKTAPKLQTKCKNIYVSSDALQR
ncbi:reverse transcriptase domain-containing protein [Tanacetum coccineum]